MTQDSFWDLFDESTKEEFRSADEELSKDALRKKVRETIDKELTDFYVKLGDSLYQNGIHLDIDLANDRVNVYHYESKVFDVIALDLLNRFYEEEIDPAGLGAAIAAGIMAPKYFNFWKE